VGFLRGSDALHSNQELASKAGDSYWFGVVQRNKNVFTYFYEQTEEPKAMSSRIFLFFSLPAF